MKNDDLSDELYRAVLSLRDLSEARRFFRDLLTAEEILEFSKRWQVAKMLYEDVPYVSIQKQTSMSSTTIARISKWLKSGMGGYALVLARLANHHTQPSRSKG
jgi:TrpR-related protein YerC/YecD